MTMLKCMITKMNEEKIQETKSKIQNDKFYNTHIMLENCQLTEPVEARFSWFLCFGENWILHIEYNHTLKLRRRCKIFVAWQVK
jgi:hypothetical protein